MASPGMLRLTFFYIVLFFTQAMAAQQLPFDPVECGYACSAKDILMGEPYLSSDPQGTPIETCNGDAGEVFTAYVSFKMQNTTGSLRYTPMIRAELNNNGSFTTITSCYAALEAGTTAIYTSPQAYQFTCGAEVYLEHIWIGWNVSPNDCGDIASVKGCNQLIPSGKCGDYNSIPLYVKMPVETPAELGQENTVSRCSDGIDNDGNGLSDCDDFVCAQLETCTYTSSTSAKDGGLESNPRLLEKIAQRYYQRSQDPARQSPVIRPENTLLAHREKAKRSGVRKGVWALEDLLPDGSPWGATAYISSPEDLIPITNAAETFSADYVQNDRAIGAILATRTLTGVYEHTKVICDRVDGTRLTGVWSVPLFENQQMLMSKLERPEGAVEYTTSFSARLDIQGSLVVENFWNVAEYSPEAEFMNFQIWAASPMHMKVLAEAVLVRLEETSGTPARMLVGNPPSLYIVQSLYRNHVLQVEIANSKGLKEVEISGMMRRTETDVDEPVRWNIPLSGTSSELLSIDTEGVYSLGITLNSPNTPDTVFFADGVWGLDTNPELEVLSFHVYQDVQTKNEQDWYVERGVQIQGVLQEKAAWYRSLKNTFSSVSLSGYQGISFQTQSATPLDLEIVLSRPGVPWAELPKKTIAVAKGAQTHQIALQGFSPAGDLEANMLVFVMENSTGQSLPVQLDLSHLRFTIGLEEVAETTHSQISEGEVRLYPNPVTDRAEMAYRSGQAGEATWHIFNSGGRLLRRGTATVVRGDNTSSLPVGGLASGVYLTEWLLPEGRSIQVRFVVR